MSLERDELTQTNALEFIKTAFDMERTIYGKDAKADEGENNPQQLEIIFDEGFKGL